MITDKEERKEMMNTVIVIPARRGSTRFPNKPMALIHGKQLLWRTWKIAQAVKGIDGVFIATDDSEIFENAKKFGANVLMTSKDCQNGTERVHAAVEQLDPRPELVVNLQGDAVLTPPWVIQAVVDAMKEGPHIQIATPATPLSWNQYEEFLSSKAGGRTSGTLVVFDLNKKALYFSKGTIPHLRERTTSSPPVYRHIGLYGYKYSALESYMKLKPTPLEEVEKLEQLRALENGIPIQIVIVDYQGRTHWSIDNPEDIRYVEEILKREGELV
jgi:3-deoxy-manno-octulosonate cytidylyltransferase (CMP-KDO synthetase)